MAAIIGLQCDDPISLRVFRYLAAGIFALTLVAVRREHLPYRRDIPLLLLLGITGYSLYVLTYNLGAKDVSVSAASIISRLAPISTAMGDVCAQTQK